MLFDNPEYLKSSICLVLSVADQINSLVSARFKFSGILCNTDFYIASFSSHPRNSYAAPVWSNTSSNYCRLQILQSKCLRVIGNYPRCTPIPRLHSALHVTPIRGFIYHLTANFFNSCPAHPNPLVRSIGDYTLADLHHQYKKYTNDPSTFSSNHSPN